MAEDKYKEKPRVEATGSPEQVAKLKAQVNDVKKTLRATDIKFRRIGGGGGAGATSDTKDLMGDFRYDSDSPIDGDMTNQGDSKDHGDLMGGTAIA